MSLPQSQGMVSHPCRKKKRKGWGTGTGQSKIEVSHPCARKKAQGWGTGPLFGILHGHLRSIKAGIALAIAVLFLLTLSGCGHQQTAASLPAQQIAPPAAQAQVPAPAPSARIAPTPAPPGGVSAEDHKYVRTHKPILTEEGLATWYTAPYKGRKAANGQVFNDHAMTAAHRTLPMGSLIVVTNLKTGQSADMRITDRGPFVEGRLIDLTIASAKATGVYLAGTARVRVEVYRTPKPINTGGRWCVQIGAFSSQHKANKLKAQLQRKYPGANVIEFPGEDSYWVRIRPEDDDRKQAERIARSLHPAEGEAFLTRLD
jgi:rare lipoprotein A